MVTGAPEQEMVDDGVAVIAMVELTTTVVVLTSKHPLETPCTK